MFEFQIFADAPQSGPFKVLAATGRRWTSIDDHVPANHLHRGINQLFDLTELRGSSPRSFLLAISYFFLADDGIYTHLAHLRTGQVIRRNLNSHMKRIPVNENGGHRIMST